MLKNQNVDTARIFRKITQFFPKGMSLRKSGTLCKKSEKNPIRDRHLKSELRGPVTEKFRTFQFFETAPNSNIFNFKTPLKSHVILCIGYIFIKHLIFLNLKSFRSRKYFIFLKTTPKLTIWAFVELATKKTKIPIFQLHIHIFLTVQINKCTLRYHIQKILGQCKIFDVIRLVWSNLYYICWLIPHGQCFLYGLFKTFQVAPPAHIFRTETATFEVKIMVGPNERSLEFGGIPNSIWRKIERNPEKILKNPGLQKVQKI